MEIFAFLNYTIKEEQIDTLSPWIMHFGQRTRSYCYRNGEPSPALFTSAGGGLEALVAAGRRRDLRGVHPPVEPREELRDVLELPGDVLRRRIHELQAYAGSNFLQNYFIRIAKKFMTKSAKWLVLGCITTFF